MSPKRRAGQPLERCPALARPENLSEPETAVSYCKPPAPQSRHSRRWRGRPRFGAWDLLVWTIWIALTALVLLSLCAVLILAWPS